jgi:hypothetical protein
MIRARARWPTREEAGGYRLERNGSDQKENQPSASRPKSDQVEARRQTCSSRAELLSGLGLQMDGYRMARGRFERKQGESPADVIGLGPDLTSFGRWCLAQPIRPPSPGAVTLALALGARSLCHSQVPRHATAPNNTR